MCIVMVRQPLRAVSPLPPPRLSLFIGPSCGPLRLKAPSSSRWSIERDWPDSCPTPDTTTCHPHPPRRLATRRRTRPSLCVLLLRNTLHLRDSTLKVTTSERVIRFDDSRGVAEGQSTTGTVFIRPNQPRKLKQHSKAIPERAPSPLSF